MLMMMMMMMMMMFISTAHVSIAQCSWGGFVARELSLSRYERHGGTLKKHTARSILLMLVSHRYFTALSEMRWGGGQSRSKEGIGGGGVRKKRKVIH